VRHVAKRVEEGLLGVEGVREAFVNLATATARVVYDPRVVERGSLVDAVTSAGYEVVQDVDAGEEDEEDDEERELAGARRRAVVAWLFAAPLVAWMIPEMFFNATPFGPDALNAGMIVLSAPVLFWPGAPTLRSALGAARRRFANMDSFIALGTTTAFLTGPASFAFPIANYAGVAGMIMAFHLTGRYLEARARGRASKAIRALLDLEPETAHVLTNGGEVEVPLKDVRVGDGGGLPSRHGVAVPVVPRAPPRRVRRGRRRSSGEGVPDDPTVVRRER